MAITGFLVKMAYTARGGVKPPQWADSGYPHTADGKSRVRIDLILF
jgi:hypothetical protein